MTTTNEPRASAGRVIVRDAGPVRALEFALPEGGGVLELLGPNGSGKTTVLNAIGHALGGAERVAKRDGALSGVVELDGIRVTLGKQARASGESALVALSLQGGELLRLFVDPGIKDPTASDAARIKAGLGLARITAKPEDFVQAVGGAEAMAAIATEAELNTADPVDLAGRVKRAAEAKARQHEGVAERVSGQIDALVKANEGIDLATPHDEAALAATHEAAVRDLASTEAEAKSRARRIAEAAEATRQLEAALAAPGRVAARDAEQRLADAAAREQAADEQIRQLEEQLRAARAERLAAGEARRQAEELVAAVRREEAALAGWRETAARAEGVVAIPDAELLRLRAAVEGARAAMARGAEVRAALARLVEVDRLRAQRDREQEVAGHFRQAAQQAEGVLTQLFAAKGGEGLQVRDGRLVVTLPERGDVYFGELSHGQRYRMGIALATAGCGPGGLIPLDQIGWEGLDPSNRADVLEEARARRVTIVTARASDGALRAQEYAPAGEG